MPRPERGHLAKLGREGFEPPVAAEPLDGTELRAGGPAGAPDVGVVGIREAVRAGPCGPHDRSLLQPERGLVRAEDREELRHSLEPLQIGERMTASGPDREPESLRRRELGEEPGAVGVRCA